MDTAGYVALSRQSGLWKEMQVVANTIANASTAGYRAEGVVFAEMLQRADVIGRAVAFTEARVRTTDPSPGPQTPTGGTFDVAIAGDGFFQVETPAGLRLTRAGRFMPNPEGELVNPQGHRVLDQGGAPIFVPPDARSIAIAPDGTFSADGQPLAAVGVVLPADGTSLTREDGVLFRADGAVAPADAISIVQGFLEDSNVNAVAEITRMITVQRAYEMGQRMAEREDQRARDAIRLLGQISS